MFEDYDIIHTYTRKQTIEDGVLVDLMQNELADLVREAGFKFPIAMTAAAVSEAIAPIGRELPAGQDLNGRTWDVLTMLRYGIARSSDSQVIPFEVNVWDGKRHNTIRLKAVCGPGDAGEPVITIMFPEED